jgi:uncharacterized protein YabN with tetrapyrrole methylase and pyrophosphatase domain
LYELSPGSNQTIGAKKQARKVSDMTLDEMEALWQEAKTEKRTIQSPDS